MCCYCLAWRKVEWKKAKGVELRIKKKKKIYERVESVGRLVSRVNLLRQNVVRILVTQSYD